MADHDPDQTLSIVEKIVSVALQGEFAYLPFDDVAPPLRSALRAGGETRARARKLINTLGENEMDDFAALWSEGQS
jgi:hypothetical protein